MTAAHPVFQIEPATVDDLPLILRFITELAEYEQLAREVTATVEDLHAGLFGPDRVASAVIGYAGTEPAGFALYFFNYSTFVGKPGLYLEDLYVCPEWRHKGLGRKLMAHLARLAIERGCGRMEWAVLDWNTDALRVYRAIGAAPLEDWTVQRLTGPALAALAAST